MEYTAWIMRYTLNNDPIKLGDLKNVTLPKEIEDFIKEDTYYFKKSVIFAFGSK